MLGSEAGRTSIMLGGRFHIDLNRTAARQPSGSRKTIQLGSSQLKETDINAMLTIQFRFYRF